jgi:serine/threonine protein kinase
MRHAEVRVCIKVNSKREAFLCLLDKSLMRCLILGDFGYARTIHEHSLRYTKVGTTAYLPPEVSHDQWRHARGYNKTVEYVLTYENGNIYNPFSLSVCGLLV